MRYSTFLRGTVAGAVGGLAGTIAMYLFGAGIFTLLKWPANTSFAIIGDSAAAFFSKLGLAPAGGVPLGMRLYILIGLLFGGLLGIAMTAMEPIRALSPKKKVGLSILFVELMSIPLLAAGSLSLKMSVALAGLWFSISIVMHLIFGLVSGAIIMALTLSGTQNKEPEGREEGISDGKANPTTE